MDARGHDQAQALLDRARVEFALGDAVACRRTIREGLAFARGSATPVEVGLLVLHAQVTAWDVDAAETAEAARAAATLAARVGAYRGRAEYVLAQALHLANSGSCVQGFARSRALAKSEGDLDGELEAWCAEALSMSMYGSAARAIGLLRDLRAHARETKKRMWEVQAVWAEARMRWLAFGEIDNAVKVFREVSKSRGLSLHRPQVLAELALAHADRGEIDLARASLARSATAGAGDTVWDRSIGTYYRAEIDWAGAQLARGVERIERDLGGGLAKDTEMGARSTRLWLLFELGAPVSDPDLRPIGPFFAGAEHENRAFEALAAGRLEQAEAELNDAARAWRGYFVRNELRAQWGEAVIAVRRGNVDQGRKQLIAVEARAGHLGFAPIVARVRASLQQLTPDRVTHRFDRQGLTQRQIEILRLVGQRQSSRQIGASLGLSPRTVDVHIRSAMARLSARTRLQASTLVARRDRSEAEEADSDPLVVLLGNGRTVTEAAVELGISRRTATRRLAQLRRRP